MRSIRLPLWTERLLGLDPVPVPPQAFELAGGRLRYASFERRNGSLALRQERQAELPAETFQPGLLGGPLREAEAFRGALRSLMEGLEEPVSEASLVIPDAWMRLTLLEVDELPAPPDKRQEVLRWKLKRLVPFRVEELRLGAVELSPPEGDRRRRRILVGFALENLLAQLEGAFAAEGIRLGYLSNRSLSLLDALRPDLRRRELLVLAAAGEEGSSLVVSRRGEPVLHRFKAAAPAGGVASSLLERDLRLTRTFVGERFPGAPVDEVLLVASEHLRDAWAAALEATFGAAAVVGASHLVVRDGGPGWTEMAALAGAAAREVRP